MSFLSSKLSFNILIAGDKMKEKIIPIDAEDYEVILSHKGKIQGIHGIYKIDEFDNALSHFSAISLHTAKGILVQFEKHKDMPFTQLFILMEKLNLLLNYQNLDAVMGVTDNNLLDLKTVHFKILITGLE